MPGYPMLCLLHIDPHAMKDIVPKAMIGQPSKVWLGDELIACKHLDASDLGLHGHHFYLGQSMNGTFKPGDWLQIEETAWNAIRRGDVIVFKPQAQESSSTIVHRVMSRSCRGLVTRGDANPEPDIHPVAEIECMGRVVAFERAGRKRTVRNGMRGRIHVWRLRAGRILLRSLTRPFRLFFKLVREHGWLASLYSESIQEVHFNTPDGLLVKFILKGKAVGTWWPAKNQLLCGRIGRLMLWARVHTGVKKLAAN